MFVSSSIPDDTIVKHLAAEPHTIVIESTPHTNRVVFLDDLLADEMFKQPSHHRHLLPYGLWPPPPPVAEHRATSSQLDAALQSSPAEYHSMIQELERPLFSIAAWIAICSAVLHFRDAQSALTGLCSFYRLLLLTLSITHSES